MLTVANIKNSKMKSGYNHVGSANSGINGHGHTGDRWRAQDGRGNTHGTGKGDPRWKGPVRKNPAEAAQDYCDYVNGTFMLAPDDIKNPKAKSGYNHVSSNIDGTNPKQWRAQSGSRPSKAGERNLEAWHGRRRLTAVEAAQDYCDYVNQKAGRMPVKLKSAGHVGAPRKSVTEDPKVAEARALLREASTDNDPSGYVYCIAEVTSLDAVKIGKSKDHPRHRLAGLQTGNKRSLYVASYIETADRNALERKLHAQFIDHNELGEWFTTTDEILEVFGLAAKAESKAAW